MVSRWTTALLSALASSGTAYAADKAMTEVGESRTEISGSRYSAEVKVTAQRNIKPIGVAGAEQLIAASTHNSVLANLNVRLRDIELPAYTIESGTNPSG